MKRGRFAPSPTGDLHLGNARTALLAWLQIRSAGGQFVLRVEDLDRGRVRDRFRQGQLDDLRWLGIDWDEGPDVQGSYGPYLQSEREELYESALDQLGRAGLLYECVCTRREIAAAASAPHADDEGPAYTGRCRDRGTQVTTASAALRLRVPPGYVSFNDELQGQKAYDPGLEVGDFVVRRKDGVAAYQLAVVVDDAAMKITHVVRGSDLLPSTSRQILIYRALGLDPPSWTHVPLMLAEAGDRFSKRVGSVTLRRLREAGVEVERVVGWIASTCGLADEDEPITAAALVHRFDLESIPAGDTPVAIPSWLAHPVA